VLEAPPDLVVLERYLAQTREKPNTMSVGTTRALAELAKLAELEVRVEVRAHSEV
jgi:hypothetical protein